MSHLRILFLSIDNYIGSDRIPTAMIENDVRCAVISPGGAYCSLVIGLDKIYILPRHRDLSILRVRSVLKRAFWEFEPDLIIPLDAAAALLLRGFVSRKLVDEPIARLLIQSLGACDGYPAVCSRRLLMDHATSLSIAVPAYGDFVQPPSLSKKEYSTAGLGVSWTKVNGEVPRQSWIARGRKRLRRVLWWAAGFPEAAEKEWLQQSFISGRLAVCNVVALGGRVVDAFCYFPVEIDPQPFGPSTVVDVCRLPAIEAISKLLIESLGYSGFANLDFIIDNAGNPYLIELNARCSGTSHFGKLIGHDLCGALLSAMRGDPAPTQESFTGKPIPVALFPRELMRMPRTLFQSEGRTWEYDIPRSQPAVLQAYLRVLADKYGARYSAEIEAAIGPTQKSSRATAPLSFADGHLESRQSDLPPPRDTASV
jgi:hypothetical protein